MFKGSSYVKTLATPPDRATIGSLSKHPDATQHAIHRPVRLANAPLRILASQLRGAVTTLHSGTQVLR